MRHLENLYEKSLRISERLLKHPELVAMVSAIFILRDCITMMTVRVREGRKTEDLLALFGFFNDVEELLLKVGEKTPEIEEYFPEEVHGWCKELTHLLEMLRKELGIFTALSEKALEHQELVEAFKKVYFLQIDIETQMALGRNGLDREEQDKAFLAMEDLYRLIPPLQKEIEEFTSFTQEDFPEASNRYREVMVGILEKLKRELENFHP